MRAVLRGDKGLGMDFEFKELTIGIGLALVVLLIFRFTKVHRERGSYAVLLAAAAAPYLMWALETHEPDALRHALIMLSFVTIAFIGARWNLWITAAAFVGHGVFAGILQYSNIPAPTPGWYGPICLSFDITIAIGLAGFLAQGEKLSDMT